MELYNGDCFEIIKNIPDNSIDLVVTDPPYLITDVRGSGTLNSPEYRKHSLSEHLMHLNGYSLDDVDAMKAAGINTGGSLNDIKKFNKSILKITERQDITKGYDIEKFADLIVPKMKRINIYLWCNKRQIVEYFDVWVKKYKCVFEILTWHKENSCPSYSNHYKIDTEFCLYFHRNGGCNPQNAQDATTYYLSNMNVADKKKWNHPTIKPLEMIERLVRNSSGEGDVVLDPFMGSGTTGVACKNLNRKFIGIEIDGEYFETAKRRIEGSVVAEKVKTADLPLFGDDDESE